MSHHVVVQQFPRGPQCEWSELRELGSIERSAQGTPLAVRNAPTGCGGRHHDYYTMSVTLYTCSAGLHK
jgi:hypothetical protein